MPFSASDWKDVVPVPQDDGVQPLAPIAYAQEYTEAMDLFRAVLLSGEKSARVLELTAFIIEANSSHYTAWKYRLDTVRALGSPLEDELKFVEEVAFETPKSYQLWPYRQAISDQLNQPQREIDFVGRILALDSKNYHAWAYRQHIVSKYDLWDSELEYIDGLLRDDVRNNSAWNQRFFVVSRRPAEFTAADLDAEVAYALSHIQKAPHNESAWNYLRGQASHCAVLLAARAHLLTVAAESCLS
ncbi:CAAX geranylgeranyltransferase alpha subunit [Polyrhizophydium stewartii]|uniref:Protein farnesyltransferase/geranylgeranyltransferase type-1 subunit alpha n=1 Tax=Polyrhizophydium stewartii TaxID=2732419 RepID=A0ABR4MY79_9FUNG